VPVIQRISCEFCVISVIIILVTLLFVILSEWPLSSFERDKTTLVLE